MSFRPIFFISLIIYFLLGFYIGKDKGVAEERKAVADLVEKKRQAEIKEYIFYMKATPCLKYHDLAQQDSCILAIK